MRSKKSIIWVISIITITIVIILTIFGWKIYNTQLDTIIEEFEAESVRIEQSLEETINHTAYIMKIMIRQISSNYEDKEYIDNILSKYRVNPNVASILSWTFFSWSNQNYQVIVNGAYGILDKPKDVSHRQNIVLSAKHPGQLAMGHLAVGSYSKRSIIPASIGATDSKGNYIGAITIGFDIKSLAAKLSHNKTDNVDFAIFEQQTKNIVIKSPHLSNSLCGDNSSVTVETKLKEILSKVDLPNSHGPQHLNLNLMHSDNNYYLYKLKNLPYIIYLHYDPENIEHKFWEDITSRMIEISVIGIVAISLIIIVFNNENKLRKLAEQAKEQALQASKNKSDFLAFSAHEIKTPLSYIIMSSEMMMQELLGPLPAEYYDYISNIHQGGLDLVTFLDDLLDKAQIERGNFKIENQVINIEEIIHKVVEQNHIRAKHSNIMIVTHLSATLPQLIADARRIVQVLNNLLSNSLKYSPEKTTITIKVFVKREFLHIVVEDQGFGIKQSDIKLAFSEYGVIKNKNSNKVKSIGLGLPLVEYLVTAHNAKLLVESVVNQGTKISIIFGPERLKYN